MKLISIATLLPAAALIFLTGCSVPEGGIKLNESDPLLENIPEQDEGKLPGDIENPVEDDEKPITISAANGEISNIYVKSTIL